MSRKTITSSPSANKNKNKNYTKTNSSSTAAQTVKAPSLTDTSGVDGYFRPEYSGSRWSQGTELFMGNFTKMIGLNFLMLIFIAPILYFLFVRFTNVLSSASQAPFTSNMGVGYLPFTQMLGYEESILMRYNTIFFMLLPILGVWLSIGLSGGLYVMRNMAWGESITIFKGFFSGVKKNFLPIFIATLIYTLIFSISAVGISYLNYHMVVVSKEWYHVVFKVVLYIVIGYSTLFYLAELPLLVTYKGGFFPMLKNGFIISGVLIPLNAFFAALALLPFLLLFLGQSALGMSLILILFCGGAFFLVVWTVYNHWIYDKFINGKVAAYTPTDEDVKKKEEREASSGVSGASAEQGYTEVGQKTSVLSSVAPVTDYDAKLHDVSGIFTRSDLEKLAKSKNASSITVGTKKSDDTPVNCDEEEIVDLTDDNSDEKTTKNNKKK